MQGLLARVNSAWGAAKSAWHYGERPAAGQIVVPDVRLDFLQSTVSDNLNFVSLRAMLRSADSGDLARGLKLFEEMQQKDPALCSVVDTRLKALTGLDYEIVSSADEQESDEERKVADEAASFVRKELAGVGTFRDTLDHLATAVVTNLAVTELVWEGLRIVETINVPSWRLRQESNEPGVVRVVTVDDVRGIQAKGPKWVVHTPHNVPWPLTKALLRTQAFIYLIKMLAIADWAVYCEIYGMPIRIAKYEPGATPEERSQLIDMMENLGSKAFGIFSRAVTLEFVESSQRGIAPFKELIQHCDKERAKLFLGGNLPADTTGGTGTFAAAKVQDDVREDLRDDDIRREGRMVQESFIAPMCAFHFRRDVPLPSFRRIKPETIDRKAEGEVIVQAQQAGIGVGEDYARERMGIPKPDKGETVLTRPDAFETGLEEGADGGP